MKKNIKKALAVLLSLIFVFSVMAIPASAVEVETTEQVQVVSAEGEIIPFADIIEYKYRTYFGVLQYRRWNATRGYWVDPYWINLV